MSFTVQSAGYGGHHAGIGHGLPGNAQLVEAGFDESGSIVLLERQLGVGVQVAAQGLHVAVDGLG